MKKNLSSVVKFNAVVGSSFRAASATVRGDLSHVSEAYRTIKGQQEKLHRFAGFDMKGLALARRDMKNAAKDLSRLEAELAATAKPSKKLTREFERAQRKAKRTSKAYHSQKNELSTLSRQLRRAGVNTRDLEGEFDRMGQEVAKAEHRLKAMKGVLDADIGGSFRNVAGQVGRLGAAVGAGVGVVGTAVTMTNKLTSEQSALAQALGVSANGLAAWGGLAKEAGFDADTVGDLFEELNNKLGESAGLGEITPVTESLQILGLSFEELQGLKPEQQFERVAEAIQKLDDHAQAVSAADILMGGEANKFFGYLRSRKQGVGELLDQQKQLNVLSDEGREGAKKYNVAFGRFSTVVSSTTQEVFGLIGGALAPIVEKWGPKLADWVRENRGEFVKLGQSVERAVPVILSFGRGLFKVISFVGSAMNGLASIFGGFENLAIAVGVALTAKTAVGLFSFGQSLFAAGQAIAPLASAAIPGLIAGIKAVGFAMMSTPLGWIIGGVAALCAGVWRLVSVWDRLKKAFSTGGVWGAVKTFFGFGDDEEEEPKKAVPGAAMQSAPKPMGQGFSVAPVTRTSSPSAQVATAALPMQTTSKSQSVQVDVGGITVHAAPGQDPEAIADKVLEKFQALQRDAQNRALYDYA
ncbi:hypothetical protein LWC08_02880 [Desulfobaculum bizertense]|uniref:phage tail tape measure protein n=1 Tax=Desulfobaculum bizertense TaxID=376490 RepID=UPI001F4095B7|nr:phage tail tape measure protein [Desulfobaculum bizertense]UIJ38529.1 hypothetical protein LWC08_02880 [Desulfobaculum bizertense]